MESMAEKARILDVARDIVRRRTSGCLAMDASSASEDALEKLSQFLSTCIRDPEDLARASELANSVASAAERDRELKETASMDRRGSASDARGSTILEQLAQYKAPRRL
jgi:hypothetical protein